MRNLLLLLSAILFFSCGNKNDNQPKINFNLKFLNSKSQTDASLRGLSVVNENIVWATGSKGTILRSVDAGKTFRKLEIPAAEEIGFRDVHAVDENTALVMGVGSPARFFMTQDGGENWKEVYSDSREGIFFDSVEFWDDSTGVAFSDPIGSDYVIIKTTDGGKSWRQIDTAKIDNVIKGEAAFAASGTCISTVDKKFGWIATGGSVARVFKTSDRGESWQAFDTPMIQGIGTTGIYSVAFYDSLNGCIVGGDYTKIHENNINAAVTSDGGDTWERVSVRPKGFKSCVTYLPSDKNKLIATGTSGTDISADGGMNWVNIDTTSFNSLLFSDDGKLGIAVGDNGIIKKIIVE